MPMTKKPLNKLEMLEKNYPSIELAYPIAVSAYESMIKRFDAVDAKIQNMMSFAIALFIVIPTIGNQRQLSFNAGWFIISILFLTASVLISLVARFTGKVILLSPTNLYQEWIGLEQITFKKDFIYVSGKAMTDMESRIERKWQLNNLSLLFYFVAVVLSGFWVAGLRF